MELCATVATSTSTLGAASSSSGSASFLQAGITASKNAINNQHSFIRCPLPFGNMSYAIWHVVSGIWHLVTGIRYLVSGIWHLELIEVLLLMPARDPLLPFENSSGQ